VPYPMSYGSLTRHSREVYRVQEGGNQRDPEKELEDVFELLSVHPGFQVFRIRQSPVLVRIGYWIGRVVKLLLSLKFCVDFDHGLTLLSSRIRFEGSSVIVLDLLWYAPSVPSDCSIFVHFLDESGNICLQGDHALPSGPPGLSGLVPTQRRIEVPASILPAAYRVRLGVWFPSKGAHLRLTRMRGCVRDVGGVSDAVILGSFQVSRSKL
jgi:hypothetical protein